MAYSKTYVVWEGRHPGIYSSWEDCKAEVENFPNARYKAFSSRTEAIMAYRESDREASEVLRSISRHLKEESAGYMSNPEINPDSIAVDAGCSGNPGKMEYRGVYLRTGKEVFHQGPFEHGTNNIGEFLAIVHALALLKKAKGYDAIIILALSPFAKEPVLERYAYNERDSVQADNAGIIKTKEKIEAKGPASRTTELEVSSLSQSLIREGEEAAIGLDPGRFVGNECYYRCLKDHPHTLLIHVPLNEDHPIKETLTVALLAEDYIAGR